MNPLQNEIRHRTRQYSQFQMQYASATVACLQSDCQNQHIGIGNYYSLIPRETILHCFVLAENVFCVSNYPHSIRPNYANIYWDFNGNRPILVLILPILVYINIAESATALV